VVRDPLVIPFCRDLHQTEVILKQAKSGMFPEITTLYIGVEYISIAFADSFTSEGITALVHESSGDTLEREADLSDSFYIVLG
jgi:hypothetical protein